MVTASGRLEGGAKLDTYLKKLSAEVDKPSALRVGFRDVQHPNSELSIPAIAAIQEFGAPSRGIPPRPFFRTMIAQRSDEWGPLLGSFLSKNEFDVVASMDKMGKVIQENLDESIVELVSPALSLITVMLRGMRRNDPDLVVTGSTVGQAAKRVAEGKTNYGASTKPLIDSGQMLRNTAYSVGEE